MADAIANNGAKPIDLLCLLTSSGSDHGSDKRVARGSTFSNTPPNELRPPGPIAWSFASGAMEVNPAQSFVQGLLHRDSVSVVFGATGCRKSFWLLDLAFHVATGKSWRKFGVEQGAVIYVCLEGESGFMNRVIGLLRVGPGIAEEIPLVIRTVPLEMVQDFKADEFAKWVETEVAPAVLERWKLPINWVIVDTLSQDTAGYEENNENYSAVVRNGRKVANRLQVEFTFVHHTGKDEFRGARGGSALKANVNTEIEIKAEKEFSIAKVTKLKDGRAGDEFPFKLRVVDLGVDDQWRQPITTCVVEHLSLGDLPERKTTKLTGQALEALTVLQKAIAKNGIHRPDTGLTDEEIPADQALLPEQDWWKACLNGDFAAGNQDQEGKRKAFKRAMSTLRKLERVVFWKGFVWVP